MKKLQASLCRAGLAPVEYAEVKPAVEKKNALTLKYATILASALLLALFLGSFFVASLEPNRLLYGVTLLVCLLEMGAAFFVCARAPRFQLWFFYGFLVIVYSFAIILGVPMMRENPATTFDVLLLALPLLIIDRPYRIDLLLLVATVVFCLATYRLKPAPIASMDIVNAVCFFTLAVIVNYHVLKTQYHDTLLRMHVEHERDTDNLTRLLARFAFQRDVSLLLEAERGKSVERECAIILLDIDDFKKVNDTQGHAYGDAVLRIVGRVIRSTFPLPDLSGRYGGDEMVIFLFEAPDDEGIERQVKEFQKELSTKTTVLKETGPVTVSLGIARFPQDGETCAALLKSADEALYRAKAAGKGCFRFHQPEEKAGSND